ncbi:hypothetical protein BSKO_00557 [Bryopsis sp. KO-2023]|nr:hypothetical protein BSKO_00557 [Bryopsis sp. KO-2023]
MASCGNVGDVPRSFCLDDDVEAVLIDLDDTLYQAEGIHPEFLTRMEEYMIAEHGFSPEEAASSVHDYYAKHGTTLAGLVASGYPVDVEKFHHMTHTVVDFGKLIRPDPEMRRMLLALKKPKYIFTNANTAHAKRILDILGISDIFVDIVSFDTIQSSARRKGISDGSWVVCKPNPLAFELALEQVNATAGKVLFLDDSVRNIKAAQDMGIPSVLVHQGDVPEGIEFGIQSLKDFPLVAPKYFFTEPGPSSQPVNEPTQMC